MRTPPSAQNPKFGAQGIMRARNCDMAYWVTDSRSENVKGGGSTVGLGVVADNLLSWRGRNAIHGSSRRLVPTFGIQIQGGCKVAQCSRLGTHTDKGHGQYIVTSTATQKRSPWEAKTVRSHKPAGHAYYGTMYASYGL